MVIDKCDNIYITGHSSCNGTGEDVKTIKYSSKDSQVISASPPTACNGESMTLSTNSCIGCTYLWSTGSTADTISINISGTYSVKVTYGDGCSSSGTKTILFTGKPTATIIGASEICNGLSTSWTASGGSIFSWSTGASTAAINLNTAGTYTVTITNASGCSETATKTLNITTNPSATITGASVICEGGNSTFTSTGGGTYLWSTGATNASIDIDTAGTYAVIVTSQDGCTFTGSKTLTVNAKPSATIVGAATICNGSSTLWTASSGSGFSWSTGVSTASLNLNIAGAYTVTVTNINGCSASVSKTLTITANPSTTIIGANIICDGNSSTFATTNSGIYLGVMEQTNSSIVVNLQGTYTVTVTSADGCISTGSRVLTVNTKPNIFINGTSEICSGSSTKWTTSGGSSFTWSTGASTAAINLNTAGTYTVTVTNEHGCTASASRILSITNNPSAIVTGSNVICEGNSSTFTAVDGGRYLWSNGATNSAITASLQGTYSVTVTSADGCILIGSRTLTVNLNPIITISGDLEICNGSFTTWTANANGSYLWSTGQSTAAINLNTPGKYTVTVTNSNGCSTIAARTLIVNQSPIPSISGIDEICAGATTTLISSGGTFYSWNNGQSTASIEINPLSTVTFTVTVSDVKGCSAVANKILKVNPKPIFEILGNVSICNGESTTLVASGGVMYLWNQGSTTSSIFLSPFTTSGYSVTVTDINGCQSSSGKQVSVNPLPNANISGNNVICKGESTTLSASVGNSYRWSQGSVSASITVSPLNSKIYTVTVSGINGCTSLASKSITVNSLPEASIEGITTICNGQKTTLTISGGIRYLWDTGSTENSLSISPSSSRTYSVTITDINGSASENSMINEPFAYCSYFWKKHHKFRFVSCSCS
ncbi:MAG: hypothetical protein IPO98_09260 [Saprospiraceae bacterium]|nr:hypothetical protein [Saprospiraceae bacterium]